MIESGNLIRIWNFNPATQTEPPHFGWHMFDPRPAFTVANTINRMVSCQFYWIGVKQTLTVDINGTEKVLYRGWNPITW